MTKQGKYLSTGIHIERESMSQALKPLITYLDLFIIDSIENVLADIESYRPASSHIG